MSDDYVRTTRRPPAVRIRTTLAVDKRVFCIERPNTVIANDSPVVRDRCEMILDPRSAEYAAGEYHGDAVISCTVERAFLHAAKAHFLVAIWWLIPAGRFADDDKQPIGIKRERWRSLRESNSSFQIENLRSA
jgi:hypothetical protein